MGLEVGETKNKIFDRANDVIRKRPRRKCKKIFYKALGESSGV